jgi:Pyridoxamine 5'-phosphate oxidase
MTKQDVAETLAKPYSQQLLTSPTFARFAYTGLDGGPRVVPVGYLWTGSAIVVCTVPKSAKVNALRKDPRVAVTIDTEGFPPKALLIRGTATLELVDGVPDEYLEGNVKDVMTPEQYAEWSAGVQALYDQMVKITVVPEWAKLLDFETTIPKAVEDIVRARQGA